MSCDEPLVCVSEETVLQIHRILFGATESVRVYDSEQLQDITIFGQHGVALRQESSRFDQLCLSTDD